jgi:hypothetical protein
MGFIGEAEGDDPRSKDKVGLDGSWHMDINHGDQPLAQHDAHRFHRPQFLEQKRPTVTYKETHTCAA